MSKSLTQTLIKGTLILTSASIITKLLGFFNRIFLASTIGAKEIGIYQLIFPVYLIVHCISCMGFEMGIMKFVSEEASFGHKRNIWRYMKVSFAFSLSLSLLCMFAVMNWHEDIALHLLKQYECSKSLFILAFAFPVVSIKDCILSYYYALKRPAIPAASQLFEQLVRVYVIYSLATVILIVSKDAALATIGLVAGETASCLLALCFFPKMKHEIDNMTASSSSLPVSDSHPSSTLSRRQIVKNLLGYSVPLISNRLLLTVLSSVEAVLIPYVLAQFIGNRDKALSIYGVLTGMAMTFVMFPSAITNAVATMLLPTISEAKATSKQLRITRAASLCLHYCLLLGILCTTLFMAFGQSLGLAFFKDASAGRFLVILSWLCPFIYIGTCYTSILNGLGRTTITFFNNCVGVLIRIFSIVALIPIWGITGYLIGLLVSYGLLALMCIYEIYKETRLNFNANRSILSPVCLAFLSVTCAYICQFCIMKAANLGAAALPVVVLSCLVLCAIYSVGCLVLRLVG